MYPGNAYPALRVIRGIVGDARETGLDREPQPMVYWCDNVLQPGTIFPGEDARRSQSDGRDHPAQDARA